MKVIAERDGMRIVKRFLWLPVVLRKEDLRGTRRKWLKRAVIVQAFIIKSGGRVRDFEPHSDAVYKKPRWKDLHFVEDTPVYLLHDGAIHTAFGLTYAAWLCLPRVLLQEMPLEWQVKLVELLDQFDDEFDWLPANATMYVQFKDDSGTFMKVPRELCHYKYPEQEALDKMRRKK